MTTATTTRRIYLDNAATTRPDKEVLDAMLPYLQDQYGNPSSLYSYGRETRMAIELARKDMATLLGVQPACLVFTSGGTESNNMAIAGAVNNLGCTHILYNPTEHHSVLHAVDHYGKAPVTISPLRLGEEGAIDLIDLERQLVARKGDNKKCLVCFMHANNETGVMTDLQKAGRICREQGAVFFADCVATIGHYPIDLAALPIDFATAAAHKFHGPKGVGLLYIRPGLNPGALLHGGSQERGRRAGTENVAGIIGMARALNIAMRDYETDSPKIRYLQFYAWRQINTHVPKIRLNGDLAKGLYTVLHISLPRTPAAETALFELDLRGICLSGGSACSAGEPSHVMAALGRPDEVPMRFSFSKYNTTEEIDAAVQALADILHNRV